MSGTSSFQDLLCVKLHSLGHFFVFYEVNWEDIVRAAIWNNVIFQTANIIRRDGGSTDAQRALQARLRTVFIRMSVASSLIRP
eukprot:13956679-Heterocapsa_arctica.AAC.1